MVGEQQLVQRIERDEVVQRLEGDDAGEQTSISSSKMRARKSHEREDTGKWRADPVEYPSE
jgi:hypothetical protein